MYIIAGIIEAAIVLYILITPAAPLHQVVASNGIFDLVVGLISAAVLIIGDSKSRSN